MSEGPENPALRYLRRIDGKMDRLIEDVSDLERRMTGVGETLASQARRLDRPHRKAS